jgi:hypothetical protein
MRNILEKSHFRIITSWNIIIEYSNTLHTSSNPDGTGWNASRNHISVLNVLAITKRTERTWTSRGIPRVMNTTAFRLRVRRDRIHACYTKPISTYEHRSLESLNTHTYARYCTLNYARKKVPLILPRVARSFFSTREEVSLSTKILND